MPQLIVTVSSSTGQADGATTMRERVNVADFESGHFVAQLVERLVWAVEDADAAEKARPSDSKR